MSILKKINYLICALFILSATSCVSFDNEYTILPPGKWRAYLRLDPPVQQLDKQGKPLADPNNLSFKEVTAGELPFTFDVVYESDSTFYIEIQNGKEKIRVDNISYGRERATLDDTIRIDFPEYDTYIRAKFKEGVIQGKWHVSYKEDYSIPFIAKYGKGYRFTELEKEPFMDLTGNWSTIFGEGDNSYPGIGEFKQSGNQLSATFKTETGDYRFLEGTVQEKKIYLSTFDGSHAFLFEGRIQPDSTIQGIFRSGKTWQTIWEAKRDNSVQLKDMDSMTYLLPEYESMDFSFSNIDGKPVSLSDPQFVGKKKIIQILGTWCPNCKDETIFLRDYIKNNPSEKLEVVGLAFEYYEKGKSLEVIERYIKTMDIPYPVLYAGNSKKKEAAKALPMLNSIIAYPTMIFLDEENKVQKIHTGFNGPATSDYPLFVEEFENYMNQFLSK